MRWQEIYNTLQDYEDESGKAGTPIRQPTHD